MPTDASTSRDQAGRQGLSVDPGRLTRQVCPSCGSGDLTVFWKRARLPVHLHLLRPSREDALQAIRGDVVLAFCRHCELISNLAFDPELMKYAPEYENSLHFSPRFQQYATELAARLIERHDLHDKDIIEIACGKGDFLTMLCEQGGNRGIGFDPSCPDEGETGGGRMRFVRDYYSERYADQPADFICCRHALEHIAEPVAFMKAIRASIGDRRHTLVMFEVPNVLFTLRHLGIWDVIYEHCSYFSPGSLARCFQLAGFEVKAVSEAFDGQFLCIEALPAREDGRDSATPYDDREQMARDVAVYAETYRQQIECWTLRLTEWREAGRRAVLWGSGSKGITFLNSLPLQGGEIEYVVDINPRKHGMHVTGTGQEIVAPAFLETYHPDVVVILNPIYKEEIRSMLGGMGLSPELVTV